MGDSVLMSTDGPDWAGSVVTGETVFFHFAPNCFPVPPLNARNGWHKSTIHEVIMDTHYTVGSGFHLKTHNKFSFRPHPRYSHANYPRLDTNWWDKVKRKTFNSFQVKYTRRDLNIRKNCWTYNEKMVILEKKKLNILRLQPTNDKTTFTRITRI